MLAGAWQRRGAAEETRAALSCLQHGQLERAQALLADALRRAASGWPVYQGVPVCKPSLHVPPGTISVCVVRHALDRDQHPLRSLKQLMLPAYGHVRHLPGDDDALFVSTVVLDMS